MKLFAAQRLLATKGDSVMNSLISLFKAEAPDVKAEYTDDDLNTVMIHNSLHNTAEVLVENGWMQGSFKDICGGLYCDGVQCTFSKGKTKIRLLSLSEWRTFVCQ